MMPIKEDTLLQRLEELAPFADRSEARRAFDAVLQAMRRGMNEDEADWLAVALGPALSAPLLRESYVGPLDERELYRWTKRNAKLRKSVAVEQAQVVCRALGELLPPLELERLERHLPELTPLFRVQPPTRPARGARRARAESESRALAGGRSGSSRPLSETPGPSDPSDTTQGEASPPRALPHALERAREPHNDTQLSNGADFNQERIGRSLASGQRRR